MNYDWKKEAAQAAMPDDAVEKAFFDQAATFISNKAAPLMRDPYRLGFEIVQKNDDNTRMVGIFAFRISRDLYYAPAFFLNGEIKGTDLFYRHSTKTFVPLTNDWVKYLLEQDEQNIGSGVDRRERSKAPADMQLQRIANPPFAHTSGIKFAKQAGVQEKNPDGVQEANPELYEDYQEQLASYEENPEFYAAWDKGTADNVHMGPLYEDYQEQLKAYKELTASNPAGVAEFLKQLETPRDVDRFEEHAAEFDRDDYDEAGYWKGKAASVWVDNAYADGLDWQAMLKEAAEQKPLQPILKAFILEDGGWDAFNKIAAAIEASPVFAERLVAHCDVTDFAPEELLALTKQASALPEVFLYTGPHRDLNDDEAQVLFKKGYVIKDAREKTTTVYDDSGDTLQGITKPGFYEVLDSCGEFVKAFCAARLDDWPIHWPSRGDECSIGEDSRFVAGGKFGEGRIYGKPVLGEDYDGGKSDDSSLKESMSEGIYVMFDKKSGAMTSPFLVLGKSKKNGITTYDVVTNSHCCPRTLKHNPDYDQASTMELAGTGARFIKIKGTSESEGDHHTFKPEKVCPGSDDILRDYLESYANTKSASVLYHNGDFTLRTGARRCSQPLSRLQMALGLLKNAHIKADAVEEILDAATTRGHYNFILEPQADKVAALVKLMAEPNLDPEHADPNFGVDVKEPQKYAVNTETHVDQPPESRIGDAWDPGMGQGPVTDTPEKVEPIKAVHIEESGEHEKQAGMPMETLLSASPQQLAEQSVQDKVPHMFEHGAVGSLVNTYDSSAMIDKYLPKMEQALDVAGRILFLFYWKPGDFQNLYGVDDMTNLENKLLSNFKSWGDMVLDLLKKTKTKQQGSLPIRA